MQICNEVTAKHSAWEKKIHRIKYTYAWKTKLKNEQLKIEKIGNLPYHRFMPCKIGNQWKKAANRRTRRSKKQNVKHDQCELIKNNNTDQKKKKKQREKNRTSHENDKMYKHQTGAVNFKAKIFRMYSVATRRAHTQTHMHSSHLRQTVLNVTMHTFVPSTV